MLFKAIKLGIIGFVAFIAFQWLTGLLNGTYLVGFKAGSFLISADAGLVIGCLTIALLTSAAYVGLYALSQVGIGAKYLMYAAWILAGASSMWLIMNSSGLISWIGSVGSIGFMLCVFMWSRRALQNSHNPIDFLRLFLEFTTDWPWSSRQASARTIRSESTLHGRARLLSATELWEELNRRYSADAEAGHVIPIGAAYDEDELARNPDCGRTAKPLYYSLKKGHGLVIKATGSGKTQGFLAPIVLSYAGPIIVTDVNSELHDLGARRRRQLGQVVFKFTDSAATTATIDICEDVKTAIAAAVSAGDAGQDAAWEKVLLRGAQLNAYFSADAPSDGGGSAKFFDGSAAALVKAIFATLAAYRLCRIDQHAFSAETTKMLQDALTRDGQTPSQAEMEAAAAAMLKQPEPDLIGVYEILSLSSNLLQCWLKRPLARHCDNQRIATSQAQVSEVFGGMHSKTFGDVHATARNNLQLLDLPFVRYAFSGNRERDGQRFLSYADVQSGRWSIFLAVKTEIEQVDMAYYRVMFFGLGGWLKSIVNRSYPLNPLFMMDEAHLLKRSNWLIEQLAFARKYFSILLVYQDIGQLKEIYGESIDTVYEECKLKVWGGLSSNESTTELSEIAGSMTVEKTNVSYDAMTSKASTSTSLEKQMVLEPDRIRRLNPQKLQVVQVENLDVAITGTLFYPIRDEFVGMWDKTIFDR